MGWATIKFSKKFPCPAYSTDSVKQLKVPLAVKISQITIYYPTNSVTQIEENQVWMWWGLSGNCPYRCLCLNTYSQLVVLLGEISDPLADGALLKEVRHWGWTLKISNPVPLPDSGQHVTSWLLATMPSLLTRKTLSTFSPELLLSGDLSEHQESHCSSILVLFTLQKMHLKKGVGDETAPVILAFERQNAYTDHV